MKKFDQLIEAVASAQADEAKFEKGNAAAGTRLRKKMQDIKKLAQEIREEVSEVKNTKA